MILIAASEKYAAGIYTYQAYVVKPVSPTEKYTIETGQIEILPNISAADSQVDFRSHAKKVLDALESLIEGKATSDAASYSIAGRSISKMTPEELIKWRSFYLSEYQTECDAKAIAKGLESPRRIGIRFRRP